MHLIPAERIQRIHLGRMIAPTGTESGSGKYTMRLGKKGDGIREQIEKVIPALQKFALKPEQSLYADNDGALERFSSEVLKGAKKENIADVIERIIDTRPFLGAAVELEFPRMNLTSYDLRFDSNFIAPDIVPTAGLILSQERRWVYDNTSRSRFFKISQVMESYLLAAAVLRRSGIPAYPSTAVICPEGEGELHKPVLAILDLSQSDALVTFDLLRKHPLMGSLELISDSALWGIGHVMRAENRVKRLMSEISLVGMDGMDFDSVELQTQAHEIASSLFQCHLLWPGCHFIANAFLFLRNEMYETSKTLISTKIGQDWEVFSMENAELVANPILLEQYVHEFSMFAAANLSQLTSSALAKLIEKHDSSERTMN